uniref:Uncharacterized protein n=1 Tax=Rhizophora mucronata TaxID=61149 RepID=A0A2P2R1T7_RHIMU
MVMLPSLPRAYDRSFVRITDLRLELAPETLVQRPSPAYATTWAIFIDLLDCSLHSGTLLFQLMHPRPHAE